MQLDKVEKYSADRARKITACRKSQQGHSMSQSDADRSESPLKMWGDSMQFGKIMSDLYNANS